MILCQNHMSESLAKYGIGSYTHKQSNTHTWQAFHCFLLVIIRGQDAMALVLAEVKDRWMELDQIVPVCVSINRQA